MEVVEFYCVLIDLFCVGEDFEEVFFVFDVDEGVGVFC